MLDGFGGIHMSSSDLPKPIDLPYLYFDIMRNLEVKMTEEGMQFYLLDGFGAVHTTDKNFKFGHLPYFGIDLARDLEPSFSDNGWFILDAYGLLHRSDQPMYDAPLNNLMEWLPLARSIVRFRDDTSVILDGYGGIHTNPFHRARNRVDNLSPDFYFPGWDIIWDVEIVPDPIKENGEMQTIE